MSTPTQHDFGPHVAGADGEPFLLSEAQKQLRDREVEQRHLIETQQSILNALPSHIALLDGEGVILAVNEAEKAARIKVVDYRMIGATGRVYLSGTEADVRTAADAATAALGGSW